MVFGYNIKTSQDVPDWHNTCLFFNINYIFLTKFLHFLTLILPHLYSGWGYYIGVTVIFLKEEGCKLTDLWLAGGITVLLFLYLVYALMKPEEF